MANFLMDSVKAVISNAVVDKAASFIGIENRTVTNLMKTFLPALIGGVAHKGRSASGASDIMDLISRRGLGDDSIGDLMGIFSDKSKGDAFMKGGSEILPAIFGNRQDGIMDVLLKGSGVKKGIGSSLMSFLAPIVLSKLGSVIKNKAMDAAGLSRYLGEQKSSYANLIPGGLFDGNAGVAASGGTSTPSTNNSGGGGGFLKWLLPLLLIGGLVWFLTKGGCNAPEMAGNDTKTEMKDDHAGHDHSGHDHSGHDHSGHDHSGHDHSGNKGTSVTNTSSASASYSLNAAGDIVDANGKVIHKSGGYSIDDSGNLVDAAGNVISRAGAFGDKMLEGLRKTYGKLTGTKYSIDANGNLVDGAGKILYKKGDFMEKDGYYVDKDGNRLGRILKKIGEAIANAADAVGDAAKDAAGAAAGAVAAGADKFKNLFSDMVAKKAGVESSYRLNNIEFNEENHRITNFSKAEVEGLAAALKANPDGKMQVSASTLDRAKVVKQMLVTLGVKDGQISAKKNKDFDTNQVQVSVD